MAKTAAAAPCGRCVWRLLSSVAAAVAAAAALLAVVADANNAGDGARTTMDGCTCYPEWALSPVETCSENGGCCDLHLSLIHI